MDILINGTSGLVDTDEDVTLDALFEYLRQELLKQRRVARTFTLDGAEVDIYDPDNEVLSKTPADYKKLEVQADSVEIVAKDIMDEFVEKVPLLSQDAISITENLQAGDTKLGREKLLAFINQTLDVVRGLTSVSVLVNYDPQEKDQNIAAVVQGLNNHLVELGKAVSENDLTTVGDVLEFDIAPGINELLPMIKRLREDVTKYIASQNQE